MSLGKIALALWVLTVGAFAFYFVRGSTTVSTDQRQAIQLSEEEKDLVLAEMRTMLAAVNGILKGLHGNDMTAVATAAKSAGMGMAVDASPAFMAKLPLEFKTLGMSLHEDFDKLSADVEGGLNKDQVIHRLSEVTNKCVACHQIYRLSSGRPD